MNKAKAARTKAIMVERAKLMLAARRASDPCYQFPLRMTATQKLFWDCRALTQLLEGLNQSGKTMTNLVKAAAIFRGVHPGYPVPEGRKLKVLFICPTRKQANAVFYKRLFQDCEIPDAPGYASLAGKPLIPANEIVNGRPKTQEVGMTVPIYCKLINGNEAYFIWSDSPKTWEAIQGITGLDLAVFDEDAGAVDLLNEVKARQLKSRSDAALGWGGMTLWSATPTTGSEALDNVREMCLQCDAQGDHRMYQRFVIAKGENPAVSEAALAEFSSSMTSDEADIRVHGVSSRLDTMKIYPRLDYDRHVAGSCHVVSPSDNIWVVFDPGWAHPFGMLVFVVTAGRPNAIRLVQFWAATKTERREIVRDLACWLDGRFVEAIVVDPAANSDKGGVGQTTKQQLAELLDEFKVVSRQGILNGQNRHDHGIPLVEQWIDEGRIIFDPATDDNGMARCWTEMVKYRKKKGPDGRVTGVFKEHDEAPDCIRYGVTRQPCYYTQPSNLPTGVAAQLRGAPADPDEQMTPWERELEQRKQNSMRAIDEMRGDAAGGYKRIVPQSVLG